MVDGYRSNVPRRIFSMRQPPPILQAANQQCARWEPTKSARISLLIIVSPPSRRQCCNCVSVWAWITMALRIAKLYMVQQQLRVRRGILNSSHAFAVGPFTILPNGMERRSCGDYGWPFNPSRWFSNPAHFNQCNQCNQWGGGGDSNTYSSCHG